MEQIEPSEQVGGLQSKRTCRSSFVNGGGKSVVLVAHWLRCCELKSPKHQAATAGTISHKCLSGKMS